MKHDYIMAKLTLHTGGGGLESSFVHRGKRVQNCTGETGGVGYKNMTFFACILGLFEWPSFPQD